MKKRNRNNKKKRPYDVIIVGAGAAGGGCGIVLQHLGVERFTIVDRHDVGASFRHWPAETRLLTPSFTINGFGNGLSPLFGLFGLPEGVAAGVIFAIVRKDGLLILNQGEGALLGSLLVGQIFVLVYLASTLTPCLVTLWTVRKELGGRVALKIAGRQALTSIVSSFLLALVLL